MSKDAPVRVMQLLECGGPGGTGRQAAAICNALDPARFESVLVYSVRSGNPEDYRAQARGATRAFYVPSMVREISPLRDAAALWRIYRLIQEVKPDTLHAHSSKAGVLGRLAGWWAGVPRIFYSPRGYAFLPQDRSALKRAFYRLVEWSVSWIGESVAVSLSEAALARGLSRGRPVHVVLDPYLGPERDGTEPSAGISVGACGRLSAARRPEAFLRLYKRLSEARPGLRAVWIGGGELEAEVREQARALRLGPAFEVTGWLPAEAARVRMAGLQLLVHFSRWDALPNAVIEAMAQGLPVVASDAPGCRDAVADGETGLIAKDEDELLAHCLRLLDDPGLRRRMGEAGRKRVRELFSPTQAWRRLSELYAGAPA